MLTIDPPIPTRARGRVLAPQGVVSAPRHARRVSAGGRTRPSGSQTGPPRTWRTRQGTRSSSAPVPAIEQGLQQGQLLRGALLPDALDPEPDEHERDRKQR